MKEKITIADIAKEFNRGMSAEVERDTGLSFNELTAILKETGHTFAKPPLYRGPSVRHGNARNPIRQLTLAEYLRWKNSKSLKLHAAIKVAGRYDFITRRVSVDKYVYERFREFCDDMEVIHYRALSLALVEFMDKYKK